MAKINLRPWREELRAEQQKQFVTILFGVLIIAAGLGFLWFNHMTSEIEYQKQRNSFIQSEIALLEQQIKEIDELRRRREALIERMKVIQDLQGRRPLIVRIFDDLVKTVPEGVFYEQVQLTGEQLRFSGVGDTNSRISSLMRNLESSEWFMDPNLTEVKAWSVNSDKNQFTMTVKQEAAGSEADKKPARGGRG